MIEHNHRLVLGTAQLGMPYGIANTTGQPDLETAEAIVRTALDSGICEFDTAQAYGTSEVVLGSVLKRLGVSENVNIISKLHPDLCWKNDQVLNQALQKSLTRLGVSRLHGLMLHREDLLDAWDQGLGETLSGFMQKGWVNHLGISVYSPAEAKRALQTSGLDMVQIPSNIMDRRFEDANIFDMAACNLKKLYVRSIFLQGLLFKDLDEIEKTIPLAVPVFEQLNTLSNEWDLSSRELSLGYVNYAYPNAWILFGAETPEQVSMNVSAWNKTFPAERLQRISDTFNNVSENILNPTNWPI